MRNGTDGWPAGARHCLRLGAMNDKAIVEEAMSTFDVVVLQANLAASASKGLASWAKLDRPFWIDPVAYAFSANPSYLKSDRKKGDGPQFKSTFVKLAAAYGHPFDRVIAEDRALVPADFAPDAAQSICERVIGWQQTVLGTGEDEKYGLPSSIEPVLLTIPYFPLKTHDSPWLPVNLALLDAASAMYNPARLAAGLLVERDLFDDFDYFRAVLDPYLSRPAEHIWLWISDNDETQMTSGRARKMRLAIDEISRRGKRAHLAFAGSFSSLLLGHGATSIGHGVGYWEKKNWEPIAGGGRPTLRYFFPPLGQRLPFLDADAILEVENVEDFHSQICGCETCRETLNGNLSNFGQFGRVEVRVREDRFNNRIEYDVPTAEALRLTKLHYLRARGIEVTDAITETFDPISVLGERIEAHGAQQIVSVAHLERWRDALDEG